MSTVLVVVLILLVIGALPTWPYSANWGYYPSGGLGLVVTRGDAEPYSEPNAARLTVGPIPPPHAAIMGAMSVARATRRTAWRQGVVTVRNTLH